MMPNDKRRNVTASAVGALAEELFIVDVAHVDGDYVVQQGLADIAWSAAFVEAKRRAPKRAVRRGRDYVQRAERALGDGRTHAARLWLKIAAAELSVLPARRISRSLVQAWLLALVRAAWLDCVRREGVQ